MTILNNILLFFAAYELAKVFMPQVEFSWRKKSYARLVKNITTEDGVAESVETNSSNEMPGYEVWVLLNMIYHFVLIAMIFTFNPVYIIGSILIRIWGKLISKKELSKKWIIIDGLVTSIILWIILYIV